MPRIERLLEGDWRVLADLRFRSLSDTPDAFGSTLERERGFGEELWRARIADRRTATFVAYLADGASSAAPSSAPGTVGIVSSAPFSRGPHASLGTAPAETLGLFSMWVAPSARGRGVGDALMRAVIEWARGQGARRLLLEVGDENVGAIRLYERHGFLPTGARSTLPAPREHVLEHERCLELSVPRVTP